MFRWTLGLWPAVVPSLGSARPNSIRESLWTLPGRAVRGADALPSGFRSGGDGELVFGLRSAAGLRF